MKHLKLAGVALTVLYIIYGFALWEIMTREETVQTESRELYTAVVVMPELPIEAEPVIEEEATHQEAKEPEWGFDFEYICRVVAAESRGEPYDGQVAVARCIWNSAINKGMTMEQIVELPNRYADPVSSNLVTESVRNACMDAFLGMNLPTEEDIEYFYSTQGGFVSAWHENALEHVVTIGNHKFFKEK